MRTTIDTNVLSALWSKEALGLGFWKEQMGVDEIYFGKQMKTVLTV